MQTASDSFKKGTASDNNGIRAEDIKTRQIFKEVMKQEDCTPETWRKIRIKAIYKKVMLMKSEMTLAFALCQRCTNCSQHLYTTDSIPDLTKCNRRTREGFNVCYQTLDHLATYKLLEQKCQEWGIKMWVATVDFMKAFDSIGLKSPWKALEQCGIEPQYISLFRRQYAEQKATVLTDRESDVFEIKRSTKQGDPMSSLLFNSVLHMAMKDDVTRWQNIKMHGHMLGDSECHCLTNPAFCRRRTLVLCVAGAAPKNDM